MTATATSELPLDQQLADANDDYRLLVKEKERVQSKAAEIWHKLLNLSQGYDSADSAARLARNDLLKAYGVSRSRLVELRTEAERAWSRVIELRELSCPPPENSRADKAKTAYHWASEANQSANSEFAAAVANREKLGVQIAKLKGRLNGLREEVEQIFDHDPNLQSARQLAEPHWSEIVKIQAELGELEPQMKAAYVREEQARAATRRTSRKCSKADRLRERSERPVRGIARVWRSVANLVPSPSN